MSRIRLIMLSILAVLAVSAVAASGAQAAPEYHGSALVLPAEIEGANVGVAKLEGEIAATKMIIECSESFVLNGVNSKIEAAGASKGEIEYKHCFLFQDNAAHVKESLSACTVPAIKVKFKDLLVVSKSGVPWVEDEFKENGGPFAEFSITGTCALKKANLKVEGTQICSLPEATYEKVIHEVVCSPTGGNLKFNGLNAAFFGTEAIWVKGHVEWYAE
jgi:hypothetical protein